MSKWICDGCKYLHVPSSICDKKLRVVGKSRIKCKERDPEEGSAEELLTKPIFGRKVKKE